MTCGTKQMITVALWLIAMSSIAAAAPIEHGAIDVVDGDTIRAHGITYRLIGLDAPETGSRSRCDSERAKGAEATRRLRQLVAGGELDLERVPCSCRPGTEGTRRCNYGRACGVLKARGQDVAAILIGEGLARPFICSKTRCPRITSWCD
jgi:endonuclease YncB( thermonuclease family)